MESRNDRLQQTLYKLRALFDFTQMMGEDRSVTRLMERFSQILHDELDINRMLLFTREEEGWRLLWNFRCDASWAEKIDVERDLAQYDRTSVIRSQARSVMPEIDAVIPLGQEDHAGGYMLLGDTREDRMGVSPVIKHLSFAQTLSTIAYVALQNYRFLERELREQELRQELRLAMRLQQMLLQQGRALPRIGGVSIATEYMPHYQVGGDFYDLQDLGEGKLSVCIADVSGKGISASMLTMNFQANYRAQMSSRVAIPDLVRALNTMLYGLLQGEKFITLFVARYDMATRELEYLNAGHNPPYFYNRRTGEGLWLKAGTTGIGMVDDLPLAPVSTVRVEADSMLFCYTDGLVERRDSAGREQYSVGIVEAAVHGCHTAQRTVESVKRQVEQEQERGTAVPFDDVTMVAVHFTE